MKKRSAAAVPAPTKSEFEILQVLWKLGQATVRRVHEEIAREMGYTTVLKLMQIMHEKGLLEREAEGRAHCYRARVAEGRATGDFMRELLERFFGGSPSRLVMQALRSGRPSSEELAEIRGLLDKLEAKEKR